MALPELWFPGRGRTWRVELTSREFVVESNGERLDTFLARHGPSLTRSQAQRLLEEGCVLLNGDHPKAGHRLRPGDRVYLEMPAPRPVDLVPEIIPLEVVYQDEEIIVIDKPAGLPVHPGPGHPSGTLVNALLALCPDLKGIGGELRPGIVHRLDKDTSGLIVVAKSAGALVGMATQMKEREVRKKYLALAGGRVEPPRGVIEAPIGRDPHNRKRMAVVQGGRDARTGYEVLRYYDDCSFVEVHTETGRTHQIRVHFASTGHPLVGDILYGKRSPLLGRHFLHAHCLGFRHPSSNEFLEFTAPLPRELSAVLDNLDG